MSADTLLEIQLPGTTRHFSAIVLANSQAQSIATWLHEQIGNAVQPASRPILDGFVARLDDAEWIGRWLREDTRLSVSEDDAAAIVAACRAGLKSEEPSERVTHALKQLLAQLEPLF